MPYEFGSVSTAKGNISKFNSRISHYNARLTVIIDECNAISTVVTYSTKLVVMHYRPPGSNALLIEA